MNYMQKGEWAEIGSMMTENQRELAEENIMLAYYIAHKSSVPLDTEEKISLALLGLTKAAANYSPDKGIKFATFATSVITNEILMGLRREKKHFAIGSLNQPISDDCGGELKDLIPDKKQPINKIEEILDLRAAIERMSRKLSVKERELFNELIWNPGKNQRDYAEMLGCKQATISRRLVRIREKIMRELL